MRRVTVERDSLQETCERTTTLVEEGRRREKMLATDVAAWMARAEAAEGWRLAAERTAEQAGFRGVTTVADLVAAAQETA